MSIRHLNLKFIDSLNFIPSSLEAFPKTFGIKELVKGYFPHTFNTNANKDYIGEYPSIEHYGSERFSRKK